MHSGFAVNGVGLGRAVTLRVNKDCECVVRANLCVRLYTLMCVLYIVK